MTPSRRLGETWRECFERACVWDAPAWIAERASVAARAGVKHHARHSTEPFPEVTGCGRCGQINSWRGMAHAMYDGDPFLISESSFNSLKYVEPEFFRAGSGTWGGREAEFLMDDVTGLPPDLRDMADSWSWKDSAVYRDWPHAYVIREKTCPELEFDRFAGLVASNGTAGPFYSRTFVYLDADDGWTYWRIENVINRCRHEQTFARRRAAGTLPNHGP